MAKTVAFFVRNISPDALPFSSRQRYFRSYQEYLLTMKKLGAQAYFVTDNASYLGQGRFTKAWAIDKVSEVKDFQEIGPIQADVVFEKGGFEGSDLPVVTDPRLYGVMRDKAETYRQFSQYQPRSILCQTPAELAVALADMPGEIMVVKSPEGMGGKQVYIGRRDEMEIPKSQSYPLLVQEFVDMSDGIPGMTEGAHDLRVYVLGHHLLGGSLRLPPPGSLKANVSQGGSFRLMRADDIPAEVLDMAREINARFGDLPRYCGIDFARGKQGWRLMELGDKPGLFPEDSDPLAREFMDKIAQYIMDQAS